MIDVPATLAWYRQRIGAALAVPVELLGGRMSRVTVDFDELVHQTDDAYKLRIGDETVWLPKAVCRDLDEEDGTVEVLEKFAIEKELV